MKPQQLAKLLNIADVTLRRWAGKEYASFLSPSAQGVNGARRSFTEMDARILAWVAMMKAQNITAEDITATLQSAQANKWQNLPPLPGGMPSDEPIAVVPREAVEERLRALQERYESQLQAVIKEREELKTQLEAARHEAEILRHELTDTVKTTQERITQLSIQEAELRGILKQYTFNSRRWNVAALVAVALVAGITITILVLVISSLLSSH